MLGFKRIFYLISLAILGVLIVLTVFRPMAISDQYPESQRKSLLKTEDGWIVQIDTINQGEKSDYAIYVSVDGELSTVIVSIPAERRHTYVEHIPLSRLEDGQVGIIVYKDGQEVEESMYHLLTGRSQ